MRTFLLLLVLLFSAGCTDTCPLANNGTCDEPGGGGTSLCAAGSDTTDCRINNTTNGCTNTCSSSNDGECDDGGAGALFSVCDLGTDCGDCGPR